MSSPADLRRLPVIGRRRTHFGPHFWRNTLHGYLFILPVVLGLLIWTIGPMLASAYYSLTDLQPAVARQVHWDRQLRQPFHQ